MTEIRGRSDLLQELSKQEGRIKTIGFQISQRASIDVMILPISTFHTGTLTNLLNC
jgi:hypothetical protein